jgi:hypothetical protein
MYVSCEASSWTLLHQNRKLSSRISLQNQLFCLCRLPAVLVSSLCSSHRRHSYRSKNYYVSRLFPILLLNLKAFCFGAIPDIMIELIAYWSVSQSRQSWQCFSGIETKLLGASGYWQKKSWRWSHAYVVQFQIWRRSVQFGHL